MMVRRVESPLSEFETASHHSTFCSLIGIVGGLAVVFVFVGGSGRRFVGGAIVRVGRSGGLVLGVLVVAGTAVVVPGLALVVVEVLRVLVVLVAVAEGTFNVGSVGATVVGRVLGVATVDVSAILLVRLSVAGAVLVVAALALGGSPARHVRVLAENVLLVGERANFDALPRVVVTVRVNSHILALVVVLHVGFFLVIVEGLGEEISALAIDHASLGAHKRGESNKNRVVHHFFFSNSILVESCLVLLFKYNFNLARL